MNYQAFIQSKTSKAVFGGFEVKDMNHRLHDWQADVVSLACKRGRFGGFEDCGLGKSFQQLECARQIVKHGGVSDPVLILAPLAVAKQTQREAEKFGIDVDVHVCRSQADVKSGINVINYERIHTIDPHKFSAVILDEGSIIKSIDGKIKTQVIEAFKNTRYRQTWTATPAPNDAMEFGNQSEFCGVMSRPEMLAKYFIHDGGETSKWRLKGHAHQPFWDWMAGWSIMVQSPGDIGYSDDGYVLPDLNVIDHVVESQAHGNYLFVVESGSLADRRAARKNSMTERIDKVADLVNESDDPWVVWCNYNDESTALANAIPDANEVTGSMSIEEKEQRLEWFTNGDARVLVTKPKISGFGLNWQHCRNTAIFPTDSWEQYYQMVRRFWRFGQTQPVNVHLVYSEAEFGVIENIRRKEQQADDLRRGVVNAMRTMMTSAVHGESKQDKQGYDPNLRMVLPTWMQ